MKTVAMIGPIDEIGKLTIKEGLNGQFHIKEISSETEYNKLEDVDYVILRSLTLRENVLRKYPNIKLIQRWGVGFDTVDIKTAGKLGMKVAVTSGINAVPVSEYTVALMLSVYRNITKMNSNVKNGEWRDESLVKRSYVIRGKKVGLIGIGAIGKRVANIVHSFGAEVIYYDAFKLDKKKELDLNVEYREFYQLIKESDIISIHVPLLENTKNLINQQVFENMKSTAILINTARGGIIDEKALYNALSKGTILGAGIDVFEKEPIDKNNPLIGLDNIVMSGHSAGNTIDNSVFMGRHCVENILREHKNIPLEKADFVNERYLQ